MSSNNNKRIPFGPKAVLKAEIYRPEQSSMGKWLRIPLHRIQYMRCHAGSGTADIVWIK